MVQKPHSSNLFKIGRSSWRFLDCKTTMAELITARIVIPFIGTESFVCRTHLQILWRILNVFMQIICTCVSWCAKNRWLQAWPSHTFAYNKICCFQNHTQTCKVCVFCVKYYWRPTDSQMPNSLNLHCLNYGTSISNERKVEMHLLSCTD